MKNVILLLALLLSSVYGFAQAITGPNSVCIGATITLSNSIPGGGWVSAFPLYADIPSTTTNTAQIRGLTVGVTYITYNFSGGGFVVHPVTVNPNPAPITGSLIVCSGQTTQLSDASAGGTWGSTLPCASITSATGLATGGTPAPCLSTIQYTLPTGCFVTALLQVNAAGTAIVNTVPSQVRCNGASTAAINFTSSPTGATFNWTNNNTSIGLASSGTGNIPSFTAVNTGSSPVVATITVTANDGTCPGPELPFTITVNPPPTPCTVTVSDSGHICSGGPCPTIGVSCSTVGVDYQLYNGATFTGSMSSGTGGAITFPPQCAAGTYSVRATNTTTGCTGGMANVVTLTVAPLPTLSSTLTPPPICSGTNFAYTPASSATGVVLSWIRGATSGISNPPASGTGSVNEVLINTTSSPITVTYGYTLTVWPCSNTQNVTVVVNPIPSLTSTLTPPGICSGNTFAYNPTSSVTGSTFSWSRAAIAGITPTSSAGTSNVNEVLVNSTCAPITVAYVYVITANGCTNTQTVNVVVNPVPAFCGTFAPFAICSGSSVTFAPSTASSGTLSWTRAAVSGITPSTGIGSGNISEVLTNTTTTTKVVTYVYTINSGGCTSIQNLTVSVDVMPATPAFAAIAPYVCTGASTTISTSPGQPLKWALISPISGTLSTNPIVQSNNTIFTAGATPGIQQIIYTASNTCGAKSGTITVTVGLPAITASASSVCQGGTISLSEPIAGAGTWTRTPTTAGNFSPTGSVAATVFTAASTGLTTATPVTIRYTKSTGCYIEVILTVHEKPVISPTTPGVCRGGSLSLTGTPSGGTWSLSPFSTTAAIDPNLGVLTAYQLPNTSVTLPGITYTAPTTCTVNRSVAIRALPNIGGTLKVCEGLCTPNLPGNPGGGVWSIATASAANASVTSAGSVCGILAAGTPPAPTFVDLTYTYTYTTLALSCAVTKQFTVNPAPAPIAYGATNHVCQGSLLALSNNTGPGTWTYLPASTISLTNAVNGTFTSRNAKGIVVGITTVSFTNSYGCRVTQDIVVDQSPNPGVVSVTPPFFCAGETSVFSSNGDPGGTWILGGGALSYILPASIPSGSPQTITGDAVSTGPRFRTRTVQYQVSSANCGTRTSPAKAYTVFRCTPRHMPTDLSIKDNTNRVLAENSGLKVYPNPNNGSFTLTLISDKKEAMQVTITNILGQKVKEFSAATNAVSDVNIGHAPGTYLINVTTANGSYTEKVTIK